MSDFRVTIAAEEQPDGSKAYSVLIWARQIGRRIDLNAVTYDDAQNLAAKILQAVAAHTNLQADWV
jgi:hypothetical protein